VSEDLDEELKRRAADLGMSVSNLVRNLLVNTVDMVEEIKKEASQVADDARQSAEEFASGLRSRVGGDHPAGGAVRVLTRESGGGAILGWQELVLNINAVCDACNEILPKGMKAAVGIRDGHGSRVFQCTSCLGHIVTNGDDSDADAV